MNTTAREWDDKLNDCQQKIGYTFQDRNLLRAALTHSSGAMHRLDSNERLEFLGDAILGSIICESLFRRFPKNLEGELTRIKSEVVSRQTCARLSESLQLRECLIVGKGITSGDEVPLSLMANVFESLVAAIYLDGGFTIVQQFVESVLEAEITRAANGDLETNFKAQLQQLTQRKHGTTPRYLLIDEQGPDHAKCFSVTAQVGERQFLPAWGRSKKEAEQRAASHALAAIVGDATPR
ncbi:MAG: ribonuclease III [Planctomycetota bacterium]|nr:ribonuclease III [Planctomycetota bacterium]